MTRPDLPYRPTRDDVLAAVGPREPNPYTGPDNPDPFGVNEVPWSEHLIAHRIADRYRLPLPNGHVGRAVHLGTLRELLAEMTAYGVIVGRPRAEWTALGREQGRAKHMEYTSVETAQRWWREDTAP
ncbi:hypothetical protein AB0M39_35160 [Streptomyces sp. NPDC051907]|uniref:hypothetical protein n=1 Tax=Streptomyces sp. NPDC051907 TaxID=3155284 RepID=UPI003447261A